MTNEETKDILRSVEEATDHAAAVDAFNHGRGTLTPRQALGEALACAERAHHLMSHIAGVSFADCVHAAVVVARLRQAYESAK